MQNIEQILKNLLEPYILRLEQKIDSLASCKEQDEFLTKKEVVEMLKISPSTLHNLRKKEGFPAPAKTKGKLLWRRADIVRYMEEQK